MGLLLSILLSYVGGIELAFVIRDLTHQVALHERRLKRSTSLQDKDDDAELRRIQKGLRKSIVNAALADIQDLQTMQDGVAYDNGYRVEVDQSGEQAASQWNDRRKELTEEPEIPVKSTVPPAEDSKNKQTKSIDGINEIDDESMDTLGGIPYDNGYRLNEDSDGGGSVADRWIKRRKELSAEDEQLGATTNSTYNQKNLPSENFIQNERTNEKTSRYLAAKPSEDSSSYEPLSQQSSLDMPEIHFDDESNEKPSEEQLRSMDGIKFRPIVRDDGSGRRRAFKKRQQSSSSTSSCDLRSSREDELKMFTSLEEEEQGQNVYAPIQYSNDLKVRKHARQHKRNPADDGNNDDDDIENGDDVPSNDDAQQNSYHDPQLSELQKQSRNYSPVGAKTTRQTSFEEASSHQNELVSNALKQRKSIDDVSTTLHATSKIKNKSNA